MFRIIIIIIITIWIITNVLIKRCSTWCYIAITIMISITTVLQIHIHIQANTNAGGLCCSGSNGLLISWHEERHNSYYANHTIRPHERAAHLAMFKISVSRDPKNLTTAATVENWTICLHGPMSTSNSLCFKILKFLAHLFWTWRHSHSSHISCLRFIMTNGDCYILCARA